MTENAAHKTVQNASIDPKLNGSTSRDLDPNVRQRRASEPESSVWVGASAGTGKTKVLTDRVLRLLLPRSENMPGTKPHKILCLTFTKAAASEMALRINNTLAQWAVLSDEKLSEKLNNLIGRAPKDFELTAARKLFAQVIDTAGGLKIMTLHSFCQSVLGRFPLEAGISPNFSVMDDTMATELINASKTEIYEQARSEKASPLANALHNIASTISEDQFLSLLKDMIKERNQLDSVLGDNWNIDGFYARLCEFLNIPQGLDNQTLNNHFCDSDNFNENALRSAAATLYDSASKTDHERGQAMLLWLDSEIKSRKSALDDYFLTLLKKDGQPRATLITKKAAAENPAAEDTLSREAIRMMDHMTRAKKVQCAALTKDLFLLGSHILEQYKKFKAQKGVLDYDDLITKTFHLLDNKTHKDITQNMPAWVLYKLDQGLDHILIDEAQDTNPEQWNIIKKLCDEFFSHLSGTDDVTRTVFTVGDEKQSIYSFQRASPEEFETTRDYFTKKVTETGHHWNNEDLNISFRSTRSVLEAVDMVFAQDHLKHDPGFTNSEHISFRRGQAGLVEIWPLFENEAQDPVDPWDPPITVMNAKSGASQCAETIAQTIKGWIDNEVQLESHGRAIEAGDIMILVRTRTALVNQLVRALKTNNIPVSGHDRMVLNQQLAVQDLLALAEFALLPHDDLTLACLLKSPLIGLSEDDLFALAIERDKKPLWDRLKASNHENIKTYLMTFIKISSAVRPYEFFATALSKPCPADNVSGLRAMKKRLGNDCLDPLDELLNAALRFEDDNIASLQNYLKWQKSGSAEIKRELEEAGGQVRIMTVHGSKGLQAPIVIMPDTTRTSKHVPGQSDKRLLWPQKTGLNLPLWSPRKDMDFDEFEQAFGAIEQKMDEEYRRLLYVAMTRAEDHLYIMGHKGQREPIEDCWYNYIYSAFKNDARVIEKQDGTLQLSNAQEKDPDRKPKQPTSITRDHDIPQWIFQKAPDEPTPPQPLTPSRPSESEPSAVSPLKAQNQNRFRRGNVTHKLLQFLPDIPEDQRDKTANQFLNRFAADLSESIRANIIVECLNIMNDPNFKPLFGKGSRAEVPITGLIKGAELISGQIDRLYIGENDIWIIDFKTNRPPPKDPKDIPKIYKNQMQAYFDTLKEIYPKHAIHCGLIWTDGPFLMPIDCS